MSQLRSTLRIVLRKLAPQDIDAVQQIASRSPEAAQWSRESYAALRAQAYCGWVAEAGGTLCGFLVARIASDEAEILNLAVDPTKRRLGVATALLSEALSALRAAGVTSVHLEVRESNHLAIRFYEKSGFVRSGRRDAYYQDPAEAAVLMVRKLTA